MIPSAADSIVAYAQVLFMADTCQAATLAKHFYAPGAMSPYQPS